MKGEVESLPKAEGRPEGGAARAGAQERRHLPVRRARAGRHDRHRRRAVPQRGATLQPGGRAILDAIAPDLERLPNRISVDGHTNTIPIHTERYTSNWELSGDRASGVVRYLLRRHGFDAGRLSATGYADTRPLLPRSNPRAIEINRRVEIVVIARVDNAAGRAVAGLGNG